MSFASKEELMQLQEGLQQFKNEVLGVLENFAANRQQIQVRVNNVPPQKQSRDEINTPVSVMSEDGSTPKDAEVPLSSEQYKIFITYFDPEDGFNSYLIMDDKIAHIIDVPKKFSNATDAHWGHYKRDIRQVALPQGDVAGGIERHCKLVAKNLGYNLNIKTK